MDKKKAAFQQSTLRTFKFNFKFRRIKDLQQLQCNYDYIIDNIRIS